MTVSADRRIPEFQLIANEFDQRLRLSRSSELARDGRLLEAEAMLCPGGKLPGSVLEFDLLARIHVRQGRFEDARRRWRDAAKLDGSPSHDECIELLDHWLEYRHRVVLWRLKLACCTVATVGAIFAFIRFGPFK